MRSNPIAARLRQVVSQDRMRYKDADTGADMDLSYITSSIIAMGFPASGLESAWRNHIDDVAKFLKTSHPNCFMIWNLSEREYDYGKFDNQLQDFGFPDHHSPPLDMLFKIILSMDNWLRACKDNVAVVHCMGGKGRTGTVIACYLLYCGLFESPAQALTYFAERRSKINKGVIQPSQLRYVNYFGNILRERKTPVVLDVRIAKVVMHGIPNFSKKREGCKPILKVYNVAQLPKRLLYASGDPRDDSLFVDASRGDMVWSTDCLTKGDVMIKCKHYGAKKKVSIFKTTFHTSFSASKETLGVKDLDAIPKAKKLRNPNAYPADFSVTIFIEPAEPAEVGLVEKVAPRPVSMRPAVAKLAASEALACPRCVMHLPRDMQQCPYCKAAIAT